MDNAKVLLKLSEWLDKGEYSADYLPYSETTECIPFTIKDMVSFSIYLAEDHLKEVLKKIVPTDEEISKKYPLNVGQDSKLFIKNAEINRGIDWFKFEMFNRKLNINEEENEKRYNRIIEGLNKLQK